MKSPYISRVNIKNFRNFRNTDIALEHKQVVIGENNVGKTNLLKAIQLILDPTFSDNDRILSSNDFHDEIENPKENGAEISISIELRNYEHNSQLVAQFQDAVISASPPTLKFTYLFRPRRDEEENILEYEYIIYKGNSEGKPFRSQDRRHLNIQVVKALRDVERELSSNKKSPLYKLVQKYNISDDSLVQISESMQGAANEILELDEIRDVKQVLTDKFHVLAGLQYDNDIELRPYDIDIERLLYSIQVYMGLRGRPVSGLSLGLANILYLSLTMLLLEDDTVPRVLKRERYDELIEKPDSELIPYFYVNGNDENNVILSDEIDTAAYDQLYAFFDKHTHTIKPITILAVEEPEAHLHPILQRLIYREILHKTKNSVIFTTHSPYITSVAPLEYIVHIRREQSQSHITSTAQLRMNERDKNDLERYLDAKRGELYFGKGVLLVEGITEEYLVPKAAELMSLPLEDHGIMISNINSTNFKPYINILNALKIPWTLITDGDYYDLVEEEDADGKQITKKKYHRLNTDGGINENFRGLEIILAILVDLGFCKEEDIPDRTGDQDDFLKKLGCFTGYYTHEVDMLDQNGDEAITLFSKVYSETRTGGARQQKNFDDDLNEGKYWKALKKIDDNIGKGRFAQRLSVHLTLDIVPEYIKNGIQDIIDKVLIDE